MFEGKVASKHFTRAGSSGKELTELLNDLHYLSFDIEVKRRFLRYRLLLSQVEGREPRATNVLWVHRESNDLDRIKAWLE